MNTFSNSNTYPNRPPVYPQQFQQLPHSCFPYICIFLIPSDLRTLSKTWGVYPSKANLKRNSTQFQIEIAPLSALGGQQ
jgi:hypothetical protein